MFKKSLLVTVDINQGEATAQWQRGGIFTSHSENLDKIWKELDANYDTWEITSITKL